jgi:hypothetical protein
MDGRAEVRQKLPYVIARKTRGPRFAETTTKQGLTAAGGLACAAAVAYARSFGGRLSVPHCTAGYQSDDWRRVELTAGSSLADVQRVIQISLGWSDDYQHRFCIRNHYLGASRPGGLLLFGDPEAMTLSQFAFRLHERFNL